jgi:hypothetical protein
VACLDRVYLYCAKEHQRMTELGVVVPDPSVEQVLQKTPSPVNPPTNSITSLIFFICGVGGFGGSVYIELLVTLWRRYGPSFDIPLNPLASIPTIHVLHSVVCGSGQITSL